MSKELHPSVQEFKNFVKRHPKLIVEVRSGKKSMQELYEEWMIIGEKDDYWQPYRNEGEEVVTAEIVEQESPKKGPTIGGKTFSLEDMKAPAEWFGGVFNYLKSVDMNELQGQINNVGSTIASIQSVINQFRNPASTTTTTPPKTQPPKFNQRD